MASVAELAGASTAMAGDLASGISALSLDQTITFRAYVRTVLPLDGYLFWVNSGSAPTIVKGALHYSTTRRQEEDATQATNQVVLTTLTPVIAFNELAPDAVLIAEFDGLKVAFSSRGNYFQAAGLNHYIGASIVPTMQTQILDVAPDAGQAIVSNSLPVWLGLNTYFPVYLSEMSPPYGAPTMPDGLTLYPSFAVPENIVPPYGVVHISPDGTEALGGVPYLDSGLSSWQLAKDRVRITLYGCNNAIAIQFLNFVLRYCEEANVIGLMNVPIMRDDKKTQAELAILAQKKIIDFDVSYQQIAVNTVARQMIEKISLSAQIQPLTGA